MSVVGEFTIPAAAFALEDALAAVPEMTVESDRLASHSPREVFPFLWARGGSFDRFSRALEGDPTVTSADLVDEADDVALYRLEWSEDFRDLVHEMIDHHAAIVEATARDGRWHLRLRFADEGTVSSFQRHFRDTGHEFEVKHLTSPSEPRHRKFGLTPEQYEALVTAAREGYFTIPRTASVEEVGEALGISANAASQRIRRGCETMIQSGLIVPDAE
ncbi:bacterio-opsin activator domain-containing protein [Haloarcula nitratireducens]|uniref:Helix-turn-helix domain-containing protein n=1 Tax=Haloarcula nitratireducens TaxID=2487749 RepID=A0AAW4P6B4_9EURY|nr:bacterio-opsin activator domain-containing protein [Halomicroarcula nitratireducens]MBX0293402.1 helix-turn-helix domain-containing protein [Halomicroarcula nitratireducens]